MNLHLLVPPALLSSPDKHGLDTNACLFPYKLNQGTFLYFSQGWARQGPWQFHLPLPLCLDNHPSCAEIGTALWEQQILLKWGVPCSCAFFSGTGLG